MFDTFFHDPIYNLFIFLTNYMPDFGWVIIVATIIIKFILYPIFSMQIKNQIATQKAQPELKEIQKKLKTEKDQFKKQELMLEMMRVNKKYGVKIFAPILSMVISITVLIALYWIIYKGGFPKINSEFLYSFISGNENIKMTFLNFFNLSKPSIILGFLAALTQFMYMEVSMPDIKLKNFKKIGTEERGDMMKNFQIYMKYGLPIMIFFMGAFTFKAGLTLYWITSNLFMIFQERMIRGHKNELKKIKQESELV